MKNENDINFILILYGICFLIIMILLFSMYKDNKPRILKDYDNFAIVEMDGEVYIWNKDIYGSKYYPVGEEVNYDN